jgi:serine/threonine protein kinase
MALRSSVTLGRGSQGIVKLVRLRDTRGEFAAKFVTRRRLIQFENELKVLRRLDHKHLVEFCGSYSDEEDLVFLLQPVAQTDLQTLLAAHPEDMDLTPFHGCLAAGVSWLHANDIRHRDIKPANILVHRNGVRICDFGSALDSSCRDTSQTEGQPRGNTSQYLSPEAAHHQKRDEKSDIWSLGTVFLELMTVDAGKALSDLHGFLRSRSQIGGPVAESYIPYWVSPELLIEWTTMLGNDDERQQKPTSWAREMVSTSTPLVCWSVVLIALRSSTTNLVIVPQPKIY